jgi:N-acetylmuramoyl-L-alanine amidase
MKRILVQAGHQRPLQPGFEGQTGAPGEAELVADIQQALVRMLNQDPDFHGIPAPGRIAPNIKVDGAIFLHADGFHDPSAAGYSVGYPPGFEVNRRLAQLIANEIEKLPGHPNRRPDNNTNDMKFYYGFGIVQTPGPEVLVEHGFVTNPAEHRWLKAPRQRARPGRTQGAAPLLRPALPTVLEGRHRPGNGDDAWPGDGGHSPPRTLARARETS